MTALNDAAPAAFDVAVNMQTNRTVSTMCHLLSDKSRLRRGSSVPMIRHPHTCCITGIPENTSTTLHKLQFTLLTSPSTRIYVNMRTDRHHLHRIYSQWRSLRWIKHSLSEVHEYYIIHYIIHQLAKVCLSLWYEFWFELLLDISSKKSLNVSIYTQKHKQSVAE